MRTCKRPGCEKPVKPGGTFCSKRCCYKSNVSQYSTAPVKRAKAESSESVSWWLNGDTFYAAARERFPGDAPDKSLRPVVTYGTPAMRDIVATGRHRLKQQRRDRERRLA